MPAAQKIGVVFEELRYILTFRHITTLSHSIHVPGRAVTDLTDTHLLDMELYISFEGILNSTT